MLFCHGKYELIEELGIRTNSNVKVWKAIKSPNSFRQDVVVKIFYDIDDKLSNMVMREKSASIKHPNIITYKDAGVVYYCKKCQKDQAAKICSHCGDPSSINAFIEMDYIAGKTLEELVAQENFFYTGEDALHIIWRIAEVLIQAHEQGKYHRDIKPSNIMICNGAIAGDTFSSRLFNKEHRSADIKIIDWGLAAIPKRNLPNMPADKKLQKTTGVEGTVWYMPPEQWQSLENAKEEADIYALGGVLYFLLTKIHPYMELCQQKEDQQEIIHDIENKVQSGILPIHLRQKVDEQIVGNPISQEDYYGEKLCRFCMRKKASKRPSAKELAKIISFLLDSHAKIKQNTNYKSFRPLFSLNPINTLKKKSANYDIDTAWEEIGDVDPPEKVTGFPPGPYPLYGLIEEKKDWGERVFLAYQYTLKRNIILKKYVLPITEVKRMIRAVRLISNKLSGHGNHPAIYDCGTYQDSCEKKEKHEKLVYMVMHNLSGQTLGQIIAKKELTHKDVKNILVMLLELLDSFHREFLVVRWISVETILCQEQLQELTLLEYQYVKDITQKSPSQQLTMVGGVPQNIPEKILPPELLANKIEEEDTRSLAIDIWQVGLVGYQLVRKEFPFDEKKLENIIRGVKKPITKEETPYYEIINKSLNTWPSNRYANAGEMLTALKEID